jgi:Protein of unknown function (DUF3185)
MNKLFSLALVVTGVVLVIYGLAASDSAGSGISRFFTGSPTDKTIWLLAAGVLAAALGLGGLLRSPKSP